MPKQLVPRVTVALLLAVSAYGTARLAQDYLRALFSTPEAQWQFAFMTAPVASLIGAVGLGIARFSRPPLSRGFILGSWIATLVPLGLFGLVWIHAY
jgi:hypothetical protein